MKKFIAVVKIIFSSLVILSSAALFLWTALDEISSDEEVLGAGYEEKFLKKSDPVTKALRAIFNGRDSEIKISLGAVMRDKKTPSSIKIYFGALAALKDRREEIETVYFIKNSVTIKEYYRGVGRAGEAFLSSIVPYYLIKTRDAKIVLQQQKCALYSEYLRRFVRGGTLDIRGANLFCLYVYSKYCDTYSISSETYKELLLDIDNFFDIYSDKLGEGGTFRVQRQYLIKARAAIKEYIKDRGSLFGGVITALKGAFYIGSLPSFDINNL